DPYLKNDTAALHLFIIMDPGAGKVTVGKDQLFTGKRFNPGSLEAYIFYYPIFIINDHKVPHRERTVKEYDEVIEQVSQDIVRGQRHCDSAYPQTGNYGVDFIA